MTKLAWAVIAALAVAGCADDPSDTPTDSVWPALQIDVSVQGGVYVYLAEVDNPAQCTNIGFLRPGQQTDVSDVSGCPGGLPGAWITEAILESGGEAVDTTQHTGQSIGFRSDVMVDQDDLAVVLVTSDDQHVRIPIAPATAPVPVIDLATTSGSSGTITWHMEPPTGSATVAAYGNLSGFRRHVTSVTAEVFSFASYEGPPFSATITSYAPPSVVESPLGTAMVWTGASTHRQFTPAPAVLTHHGSEQTVTGQHHERAR